MSGALPPAEDERPSVGALLGALGVLFLLLPCWAFLLALAVETGRQWVVGMAVVGAAWLVLAGLLVRYWARGRAGLSWLAAAWLALGVLTVWTALAAALSRTVRQWLGWALSPWPPGPPKDPDRPF